MRQSGLTIVQLLIGIAVAAVIAAVAIAYYYSTVEQAQNLRLSQEIQKQVLFLTKESYQNFNTMEDLRTDGNLIGPDADYLDDLIARGKLEPLPLEVFQDPSRLDWGIYGPRSGDEQIFYIRLKSDNPYDQQLLRDAVKLLGLQHEFYSFD